MPSRVQGQAEPHIRWQLGVGLARISSPSVAASARAICRRGRNIERLEIGAVGAGLSIDYVRDDSRGSLEGDGGDGSDDAVVIVVVVEGHLLCVEGHERDERCDARRRHEDGRRHDRWAASDGGAEPIGSCPTHW